MRVKFMIPGEPKGKGRPRVERHGDRTVTRTPDDTIIYENLVRTEYMRQCKGHRFPDDSQLDLRVIAYYPIPSSKSKKQQRLMEDGTIRPTKKPDTDNVLKVIADSLNQVAYKDDAQVVDASVRKFYSRKPRTVVFLSEYICLDSLGGGGEAGE